MRDNILGILIAGTTIIGSLFYKPISDYVDIHHKPGVKIFTSIGAITVLGLAIYDCVGVYHIASNLISNKL